MEKRYIGIDLCRNPVHLLHSIGKRADLLEQMGAGGLAVEITSNTRLFQEVAMDANQFRAISQSVKKTDPNDARLPLYLSKNLLPEVRMKDKERGNWLRRRRRGIRW